MNKIGDLLTAQDPNIGNKVAATNALIKLEQLMISDFTYINEFCSHFIQFAAIAQHTFDPDTRMKFFRKLPLPLGNTIMENWYKHRKEAEAQGLETGSEPITAVVFFTLEQLEKQCTNIVQANQVKKTNYAFCKNIFTTQDFSAPNFKKEPTRLSYKPSFRKQKTYRIQKSTTAAKPHLDKHKHVRVYNPERNYKKPVGCFICNDIKHFGRDCPKKANSNTREALAVECSNLNLIRTDKDILSEESIWSIRSIELEIMIPNEEELEDEPLDFSKLHTEYVLIKECKHKWKQKGTLTIKCDLCNMYPGQAQRAHCIKCFSEACIECINLHLEEDLDFDNEKEKRLDSIQDKHKEHTVLNVFICCIDYSKVFRK